MKGPSANLLEDTIGDYLGNLGTGKTCKQDAESESATHKVKFNLQNVASGDTFMRGPAALGALTQGKRLLLLRSRCVCFPH